jgi:hypothetical protein
MMAWRPCEDTPASCASAAEAACFAESVTTLSLRQQHTQTGLVVTALEQR